MKVSIWSKPLSYNIKKMFRDGYHFIDDGPRRQSLRLEDRVAVEGLGRAFSPRTWLERLALLTVASRRGRPAARMRNGYGFADLSNAPGMTAALSQCEEQINIYFNGSAEGIDGYNREAAKTVDYPLRHIPYRYNQDAVRALIRPFLSPEIYLSAAFYLKTLPVLSGVRILYSPNMPADHLDQAQFFHMDPEGSRQVKVFIAIRDVGGDNSPLTFVPAAASARLLKCGNPAFLGKRVTDKAMNKGAPKEGWLRHEAKRGGAVFLDTSRCFHFGSRPAPKPRFLLYAQYLDPFCSLFPVGRPMVGLGKVNSAHETADPIERAILGFARPSQLS